jgi:hypothetical protein
LGQCPRSPRKIRRNSVKERFSVGLERLMTIAKLCPELEVPSGENPVFGTDQLGPAPNNKAATIKMNRGTGNRRMSSFLKCKTELKREPVYSRVESRLPSQRCVVVLELKSHEIARIIAQPQ